MQERLERLSSRSKSLSEAEPMGREKLDLIAEKARLRHLKARNLLILEAAIAALLDTETPHEAAAILREHADILVRYL
ncbi:hypothetical protein F9K82_22745 [Brucella pseudogrignonensis]|nr:hypothetical protein F9K82_22745 [Brucella pseudogrignonensis]